MKKSKVETPFPTYYDAKQFRINQENHVIGLPFELPANQCWPSDSNLFCIIVSGKRGFRFGLFDIVKKHHWSTVSTIYFINNELNESFNFRALGMIKVFRKEAFLTFFKSELLLSL